MCPSGERKGQSVVQVCDVFLCSQNELQHVQMQLGVAGSKYHQALSIERNPKVVMCSVLSASRF